MWTDPTVTSSTWAPGPPTTRGRSSSPSIRPASTFIWVRCWSQPGSPATTGTGPPTGAARPSCSQVSCRAMAKVTVFGAGAMGTAIAMHLARNGNETRLWASEFDAAILPALETDRRHPALPVPLPESLAVLGPEEARAAADGVDLAVLAANSGGARTLARIVMEARGDLPIVIGVAKGLEADTLKRMSEVYAEEVGHEHVVSVGGPCLAGE